MTVIRLNPPVNTYPVQEDPCLCPRCWGVGEVVDPTEVPDIYEGHKLSRRINCSYCKGTGRISEKQIKKINEQRLTEYMKEKAQYDTDVARVLQITKNLTDNDIQLLRKYL